MRRVVIHRMEFVNANLVGLVLFVQINVLWARTDSTVMKIANVKTELPVIIFRANVPARLDGRGHCKFLILFRRS